MTEALAIHPRIQSHLLPKRTNIHTIRQSHEHACDDLERWLVLAVGLVFIVIVLRFEVRTYTAQLAIRSSRTQAEFDKVLVP